MSVNENNPFLLNAAQISAVLHNDLPSIPELESFRANPAALAAHPAMRRVLDNTAPLLPGIEAIPQTRYTHFRHFLFNGDRKAYETPYFLKRQALAAMALRLFLGERQWKPLVQDYLWDICEETTWVLPAHERGGDNDLFSTETGFMLASALHLLGDTLDAEVRARVRFEIERRIFQPYLSHPNTYWWYKGYNNWNGVCNSSVACTFLLLEPDFERVAQALEIVLVGLDTFLNVAFEKDGTSTEGVAYWHYGLINLVALGEMLRARTGGAVDLLQDERMLRIAAYPAQMLLSGSMFAAFSDADEVIHFNPGIVARLAERTGEASLFNLLAQPVEFPGDWRLAMMLRNALWWDGKQSPAPRVADAVLRGGGVARLVGGLTCCDKMVVAALKAGHNAENHNQNDIGSFLVHVDGENLLTDPGRGLYSRAYFSEGRYENIFANSYGHSVPRIGEQLQAQGASFHGELVEVSAQGGHKQAVVEFAAAYDLPNLTGLRRQFSLEPGGGLQLEDTFTFSGEPAEVEEAFITWCEVEVQGGRVLIKGERHSLELSVEEPAGAQWAVERLDKECQANDKPGVLKRLALTFPATERQCVRIRMSIQHK